MELQSLWNCVCAVPYCSASQPTITIWMRKMFSNSIQSVEAFSDLTFSPVYSVCFCILAMMKYWAELITRVLQVFMLCSDKSSLWKHINVISRSIEYNNDDNDGHVERVWNKVFVPERQSYQRQNSIGYSDGRVRQQLATETNNSLR